MGSTVDVQQTKRRANALVDDLDWCGHPFVSLRTWTCAACGRPVTAATRERLSSRPTLAPPGYLWALFVSWDGDPALDERERSDLEGIFTDRANIGRLMIRGYICGAESIRTTLRRLHVYQGVFADDLFEGWAEEPDDRGCYEYYRLKLTQIDGV